MKIPSLLYDLYHLAAEIVPKISWGSGTLTKENKEELIEWLSKEYFIILVTDGNRLSSFFISLMTFLSTGKWGTYTHVLMNCDFMSDAKDVDKFKFVEATAVGVHYSTFEEAFGSATKVCLLEPKHVPDSWTPIIDSLVKEVGIPYDDLFDLADKSKMSCVEVVINSFNPNFFPELNKMIADKKVLTPQMFRDCSDLSVAYEV